MADVWDQFPDPPKTADPWAQFPDHSSQSWGDVATQAVQNLPSSAYNMGASVAHTVAHPIETAQSVYDVGRGAVSKAAGAVGMQQDPAEKAQHEAALNGVVDFFSKRYGSMDQFKKTLAEDPAGVAMDLSTVLSGGEAALARAPGIAGKVGEIAGDAARATNPVSLAGKAVTSVAEPAVSNLLGMTTGAGTMPIRQAARAGFEGDTVLPSNMRGHAPMSDTVDMAQSALGQIRQDRSAAYKAGMGGIDQGKMIDFQPIWDSMKQARDESSYKGYALSEDAASTFTKMRDKIVEWQNMPAQVGSPYTVEATDALKQALGEIRQSTQPGTLSRRIADKVYNATKATIVKQAPDYAKTMSDYSDASDQLNEISKTFSLGEKASQDTTLRKLQSVTRNNVNTNYGQRAKLMDVLAQKEPDLPNAIAGQALSSATPRGMAQRTAIELGGAGVGAAAMHFMDPLYLASLPFFSPRVVGEAAYAGGRGARAVAPFANHLPGAAKVGNALSTLSGNRRNALMR